MKTYPINEARSDFSKLIDRALAGEPSRITRYGKEAVVMVSEAEWNARTRSAPTLGHLFAQFAVNGSLQDDIANRPWGERALGRDFE